MQGIMDLTDREFQVYMMICARGMEYKDIAKKLEIEMNTLKVHLKNIFLKTGISNRSKLIWSFYNNRGNNDN